MENLNTTSMFVLELLQHFNRLSEGNLSFKHPFSFQTISGIKSIGTLSELIQAPTQSIRQTQSFSDESVAAICWEVFIGNSKVQGVTALVRYPQGSEVRIMLNSFPATRLWRDEVYQLSSHYMNMADWTLPANTDTSTPEYDPSETLDPKLPPGIELADDVIFEAPIVSKGLQGIKTVTTAIGHASAVYGPRDYEHKTMSGACLLSLWNVSVSGLRIEAANLIQFNTEKKVAKMTVSFQPWPAIKLFHDRMRVRTQYFLSSDYFE
ncbi:hypothetical protein [Alteromonas sp. a30]|uniref:hypothetical protein n=1 Tax=Alteromonas sp. a30 TaxID=2730917 RepID=UPI00227FE000|nr:hypothetical protein [Alteromonas sp. a30]MCY7294081.1 hypothetical protein [Alteromonas sp. a30]